MRALLTGVLALWMSAVAPAGPAGSLAAQDVDEPLFTAEDALIAGGFLAGAAALAPVDVALAGWIQDSVPQANPYLRAGAGFFRFLGFPGSLGVSGSLYAAGRLLDRPDLAGVGLHTTEAIGIAVATTYLLKGLVGRARPFLDPDNPFDIRFARGFVQDRYQSFPSGHTTAAFATAAAIGTELGYLDSDLQLPVGVALFSAASLVGVSRVYHNAHWATDAVVGAAIGTFAGWKVVRYHHTRPGNRVDEIFLSRGARSPPRVMLVWSVPM